MPARPSREAPDPLVVPLSDYAGREIAVEVIQRGQGDGALVEWRAIELAGPPEQ